MKDGKFFFVCFGAIFIIGGIIAAYFGINTIKLAIASESWPTVEGKVTRSDIRIEEREVERDGRTV